MSSVTDAGADPYDSMNSDNSRAPILCTSAHTRAAVTPPETKVPINSMQSRSPAHIARMRPNRATWLVCATTALLLADSSAAAFVTGIPSLPPGLGPFTGQNGLVESEIHLSGSVSTFYVAADNASIASFADGYELTSRNYDSDPLTEARTTGVAADGYSASADSNAIASPGTLRATSTSRIARPDIRGQNFSLARTSASFTDVLVIGSNGLPQTDTANDGLVDFRVRLNLGGTLSGGPEPFASGASAHAQVWLLPYIPAVTQVSDFNKGLFLVQYYEFAEQTLLAGGSTTNRSIVLGAFEHLTPGASYWIHALLETEAGTTFGNANFLGRNALARADYSNTLEVFLEPSARNPDAQFTSASGATYRAAAATRVDAPTMMMFLISIVVLRCIRMPAHR